METVPKNMAAPDMPPPPAGRVPAHRPAAWLWIGGARHAGSLEEEEGAWIFQSAAPLAARGAAAVSRLELELRVDSGRRNLLDLPRFEVRDFELDPAARRVRLRPVPFDETRARLFPIREEVGVTVTGGSLAGRVLAGTLEAMTPYEILAAVRDGERLLVPGAIVRLDVCRPWGGRFACEGRVAFLERGEEATRLYVRLLDRRSVDEAGLLALCEAPGFSAHALWTYGLRPCGLERVTRVSLAATAGEMRQALELRREANQFFGKRPEAHDWQAWSDPLDETAMVVLASLGTRPVATARLIAGGDRAEVSQVAVHPAFRGTGLRLLLLRELARLALSLGCRHVAFEALIKLAPAFERMGAKRLDAGEETAPGLQRLSFDLRQSLRGLDRESLEWQAVFGPAVDGLQAIRGPEGLGELLDGGGRWTYRLRKLLVGAREGFRGGNGVDRKERRA
jgi:GNAT superfamily N-acetyltransferase